MDYLEKRILPDFVKHDQSQTHPSTILRWETKTTTSEYHIDCESQTIVFQHLILWLTNDIPYVRVWYWDSEVGEERNNKGGDLRGIPEMDDQEEEEFVILFDRLWNGVFGDPDCIRDLGRQELINLIRMKGNNNAIDTSSPVLTFDKLLLVLPKLRSPWDWGWGIIFMNNILGVQELSNGDIFLIKGMRPAWTRESLTNNHNDRKIPCIDEHNKVESLKLRFKQIEWKVPELQHELGTGVIQMTETSNMLDDRTKPSEKKDKEHTVSWFNLWISSVLHMRVGLQHLDPYPITQTRRTLFKPVRKIQDYDRRKDLNLFTGYHWTISEMIEAYNSEKGKFAVSAVLGLMSDIICDRDEKSFATLQEYCGSICQNPGLKLQFAPYIKGTKGIGKSLFASIFVQLYGNHAAYMAGEGMDSDFNGFLKNGILFVNLDEFPLRGTNVETLKSHITQGTIKCRAMYREGVTIQNLMNYMLTSNNDPLNLNITADERRFFLLKCRDLTGIEQEAQKTRMTDLHDQYLFDEGRATGYKAVIWYFLTQVKLEGSLHLRVPKTKYFRQMMESGMSWITRWWKNVLERGGIREKPGDGEKRYNWVDDMNQIWTWKNLLDESYTSGMSRSGDPRISRETTRNVEIETLKRLVVVCVPPNNKPLINFRLKNHLEQVKKFRELYPWISFNFESEELEAGHDLYVLSKKRSHLNESSVKRIRAQTENWNMNDFLYLVADANQLLASKKLRLTPITDARSGDDFSGSKNLRAPRVRIEEVESTDDDTEPEDDP